MTNSTIIGRILSPVSVAEFGRVHFQQRPLLVPGNPSKFDFLFRQDDFKYRLDQATEIRAVFPHLWQASIRPGDIKEMINAGATICVTGMEKAHRKLGQAARRIQKELRYPGRVSFRAYLSPPGGGFDIHFDARVATSLQIAGTKRWWYSRRPAIEFPVANSSRPPGQAPGEPRPPTLRNLTSVLLCPGDLLCLPAGTWHRAEAESMSLALNLAFDHNGVRLLESIALAVEQRLEGNLGWRKPPSIAPGASARSVPPIVAAELRTRIDYIRRELATLQTSPAALRRIWLSTLADE